MFNIVEKNRVFVKGIMIAVTATFVMWGIGGYLGMGSDDGYIAKVGSNKIYMRDIDNIIQQNPQNTDKVQVLLNLINRQLLLNSFDSNHMIASKEQLQQQIANIPMFLDNGKFNMAKYKAFLSQRLMTAEQFQNEISQQILLEQTLNFFKSTYYSSDLFNKQFVDLLSRQRNVSSYIISPSQFYSKVNVTDKDITSYYQQNIVKFTTPEQAKVQYLILSPESVMKTIKVSDADIEKYIAEHKSDSTKIDVSHILLTVPQNADAATREAVKAKAQKILAEVTANPGKFAALAKQYSQDPVSAKNGGDLGYFGKGAMVKPFEDAAFNLKPGQISQIVETQFGYHILKLNNIQGTDSASLKATAIAAIQKQQSTKMLQKQLEQLNDLTYNQPNSLDPAAKKLGLTVFNSDWVKKGDVSGEFADPKIQQAIFNKDVIKNHNNSEVVSLGDKGYAVYRISQYQASVTKPLAEVKDQVVAQLKEKQASTLAFQEGQAELDKLKKGTLQLNFDKGVNVTLLGQAKDISPQAVKQIFSTAFTKAPAYTGSINAAGAFVIYRINSENIDPKLSEQNKPILNQFNQNNAMLDLSSYIAYLRTKYSVTYRLERLNQTEQQQQQ
ncbi:MAG: peptidylprolyl isomerase [Burkholderiales bacterium]|jgi:peptidyl-prolyl cis-trans isomerase D|nr:peptidylprolyl isomerase [Burkholderiales bacterium]